MSASRDRGKWAVNSAVRGSELPALARLIMLVLSDIADAATAEIPNERTPSLTDLVVQTGMSRASVARFLNVLESGGWVVRSRPAEKDRVEGDRTRYRLVAPSDASLIASQIEGALVSERDHPSVTGRLGIAQAETTVVSEGDQSWSQTETSSYNYRNDLDDQDDGRDVATVGEAAETLFGSTADAAKPRGTQESKPSKHDAADDLAKRFFEYYKAHPTVHLAQPFLPIREVVRTAVANGNDLREVARALHRLAEEGRPISGGTLGMALREVRGVAPAAIKGPSEATRSPAARPIAETLSARPAAGEITSAADEAPGAAEYRAARQTCVQRKNGGSARSSADVDESGFSFVRPADRAAPDATVRGQVSLLVQGADVEQRQREAQNGRQAVREPLSHPTATGDVLARVGSGSEVDDSDKAAAQPDENDPEDQY